MWLIRGPRFVAHAAASVMLASTAFGQPAGLAGGQSVLVTDALLRDMPGNLAATGATASVVPVQGMPFKSALRVVLRRGAVETNATQSTMPNLRPVRRGDGMLARFWVRGASANGQSPARIEFLFEQRVSPWTKSVASVASGGTGGQWRRYEVPFSAAESYQPGEAMASIRLATQPQTVEVGGLEVLNYGASVGLDELAAFAIARNPLGSASVAIDLKAPRQKMLGLGGNFCQPRYGSNEPMDAVGEYVLKRLDVAHARIGLPLEKWAPEEGRYVDEGPAHASFLALQEMARRKIPTVVSVWEGPVWMLGGPANEGGRTLPAERYDDCIEALVAYLRTARDKYGAVPAFFSFNEPDYGVNFKFTSVQMGEFVYRAGKAFAAAWLKTKLLVADTANGSVFPSYARPLLEDARLRPFLGPLAFHSWDALGASEEVYRSIAALGREFGKPVWCLEAGHDAALWQSPDPWRSWQNALRTAQAYVKTVRLTEAQIMDYWTYQDNYPLVDKAGKEPYRVFHVMRQMQDVLGRGARVVATTRSGEVDAVATVGPKRGQVGVLMTNPHGAGVVRVSGLPPGLKVRVVVSDAGAQRRPGVAARVDAKGRLRVPMPATSVVSVVAGG